MTAGAEIRGEIASLVDADSFVELSAFSFSKNEFYGEKAEGEGVVTGFAAIDGYPFYVVAQNYKVLAGGVSKANCEKIVKCLDAAEKNQTPVIYLLHTQGVQVGEGVSVLEGLARLLLRASQLKGVVPQYVIVNGEVYGSAAILAGIADFTFFVEGKSVLAVNSPLVISAKAGKNLSKEQVGGADALDRSNLVSFRIKEVAEAKDIIAKITDYISTGVTEAELNEAVPALNEKADAKALLSVFESYVEVGASYASDIKTVLGRIGGISVAAVIFDRDEGVRLTAQKLKKIRDFAEFASFYGVPFVTFVNCVGLCARMENNNSLVLKEAGEYLSILDTIDTAKIAVVTGKAIGLGYSLFAAKSMGFDYSYALATSKIALFDSVQGAEIEFGASADRAKLAEKYADENSDPINAAKNGYIDNIIEPQFLKQYLIASLQMLLS